MNIKDYLRLGVPLGEAKRRATDLLAKFILVGDVEPRFHQEADGQTKQTPDQTALR